MKARDRLVQETAHALHDFTAAAVLFSHVVGERRGLSATDARCVDYLRRKGPATAGELAGRTGLTSGAVTAMIDRLEAAGMVRRERDPADRRRVVVAPLDAEAADPLVETAQDHILRLFDRFDDAGLTAIRDFMTEAVAIQDRELAGALARPADKGAGKR